MLADNGTVLIIIRTYVGHDDNSVHPLRDLLQSLIDLNYKHWRAIITTTDSTPFPNLHNIVSSFGDSRFTVDIETGDRKPYDTFEAGYTVTDQILYTYGPQSGAQWLLITNGDNYYFPEALDFLDPSYDIVGFDFYSRWLMKNDPWCKRNRFETGYTDLGANIFNLERFLSERRLFTELPRSNDQDGVMTSELTRSGWSVKHINKCLLSHNPNEWSCKEKRAVWYPSPKRSELGCLSYTEATVLEKNGEGTIQTDPINNRAIFQFNTQTEAEKSRESITEENAFRSTMKRRMYAWRLSKLLPRLQSKAVFDSEYYLTTNPTVASTGFTPIEHYYLFGARNDVSAKWIDYDPRLHCVTAEDRQRISQNTANIMFTLDTPTVSQSGVVSVNFHVSCTRLEVCHTALMAILAFCDQNHIHIDFDAFCSSKASAEQRKECREGPLMYFVEHPSTISASNELCDASMR